LGSLKTSLLCGPPRPPSALALMRGEQPQLVSLAVKLLGQPKEFLLREQVETVASRPAAARSKGAEITGGHGLLGIDRRRAFA
jgi:hypothetical protein